MGVGRRAMLRSLAVHSALAMLPADVTDSPSLLPVPSRLFILHVICPHRPNSSCLLNASPALKHQNGIPRTGTEFKSVLSIEGAWALASHVPSDSGHSWVGLFSSRVHGQSLSQLHAHCTQRGPLLILVKDSAQTVFGGHPSSNAILPHACHTCANGQDSPVVRLNPD